MSRPLILILCCLALASCNTQTRREDQAKTLYMEGVRLREQRLSEEAAECFLTGLEQLRGVQTGCGRPQAFPTWHGIRTDP